jgi:hypothetical protein
MLAVLPDTPEKKTAEKSAVVNKKEGKQERNKKERNASQLRIVGIESHKPRLYTEQSSNEKRKEQKQSEEF